MDPLSDLLHLARARCVLAGGLVAGGDWSLLTRAPRRIELCTVARGEALLTYPHGPPVRLRTGDAFVVDGSFDFVLAHGQPAATVDAWDLYHETGEPFLALSSGEDFLMLGCHIQVAREEVRRMRELFPPLLHLPSAHPDAPGLHWLLERLEQEMRSDRAGSDFARDQLAQLLLLTLLRYWLDTQAKLPASLLRVISTPELAPALRRIHGRPAHPHTVEELARSCAMSRTAFACRFRDAAGEPPMTYLRRWRLRLARQRLRDTDDPVSAIARAVGYLSESSFSTAFRRELGHSPSAWRTRSRRPVRSNDDAIAPTWAAAGRLAP